MTIWAKCICPNSCFFLSTMTGWHHAIEQGSHINWCRFKLSADFLWKAKCWLYVAAHLSSKIKIQKCWWAKIQMSDNCWFLDPMEMRFICPHLKYAFISMYFKMYSPCGLTLTSPVIVCFSVVFTRAAIYKQYIQQTCIHWCFTFDDDDDCDRMTLPVAFMSSVRLCVYK